MPTGAARWPRPASHAPAINLTERAIHNGIAAVGDLLQGQATHGAERMPSA